MPCTLVLRRALVAVPPPRKGEACLELAEVRVISDSGEMLGVLQLINRINDEAFTEHDHELLQAFSAQVAMAIENCLVFERLMTSHSTIQKANEQITQLLAINRELTREPNLRRMTAAVRRHALALTRSEESEIYMIDHTRNQLVADSSLDTRYNIGWLRRGALKTIRCGTSTRAGGTQWRRACSGC